MTVWLLAYSAALLTVIAGAFVYEVTTLGPRYRAAMLELLAAVDDKTRARFLAEWERTLHDRIRPRRDRVETRDEAKRNGGDHRDEDEFSHAVSVNGKADST